MKAEFRVFLHPLGDADTLGPVTKISNAVSFPSLALGADLRCPNAFRLHQSFGRFFQLILHGDVVQRCFPGRHSAFLSDIRAATSLTNSSPGKMSDASLFSLPSTLHSLSRVSHVGFERS